MVAIKGLEMPKCCNECPLFHFYLDTNGTIHFICKCGNMEMCGDLNKRNDFCPLIEADKGVNMFFEVTHKGTNKKMIVNIEKIDFVTECQVYGREKSNAIIQINGCPYEVKETYEDVVKLVNVYAYSHDVLGKIKAEIEALSNANPSYTHTCDVVDRDDVLDIIDKYREGSEE